MARRKINYKDVLKDTYEISSKGKIFDLRTGEKIKPTITNGNKFVKLDRDPDSEDKYPYPLKVSRLVAKHFITKKLDGKIVTFMDLNPKNVKADNLLVVTEDDYKKQFSYLIKLMNDDLIIISNLVNRKKIEKICEYLEYGMTAMFILNKLGIHQKNKNYRRMYGIIHSIKKRDLYFDISKDYDLWDNTFDFITKIVENNKITFEELCNDLSVHTSERVFMNAVYKVHGENSLKYFEFLNYNKVKVKKVKK